MVRISSEDWNAMLDRGLEAQEKERAWRRDIARQLGDFDLQPKHGQARIKVTSALERFAFNLRHILQL